jgi:hypothetical protein
MLLRWILRLFRNVKRRPVSTEWVKWYAWYPVYTTFTLHWVWRKEVFVRRVFGYHDDQHQCEEKVPGWVQ